MTDLKFHVKALKDAFSSELVGNLDSSLDTESVLSCFDRACQKIFNPDDNFEASLNESGQPPTTLLNSTLEDQVFELTVNDIDLIRGDLNQTISAEQLINKLDMFLRRDCPNPPCPRPRNVVLTPATLEELLKLLS